MKATAVSILVLVALVAGSTARAAPDDVESLGTEIAALTEAVSAQLKLLKIYESMGKTQEAEATKRSLRTLLDSQQRAISRLRAKLGGEARVNVRTGGVKVRRTPPPEPRASDRPFAAGAVARPKTVREVIDRGLKWLADHQDDKGFWDADGWMAHDAYRKSTGSGYVLYDPGVTGLALLAFLGDGHTHKRGDYKGTVKNGLLYLKQIQDPEGCFGPRTSSQFSYNHGICALAMVKAYAQTSSPIFKQSAQLAVDFTHKMQNPYMGWRYGVRPQDNDTSVTGWMIAVLHEAKQAGLRVDDAAFNGAMNWIEKVTDPEFGRVGYIQRGGSVARPEGLMDKFPPDKSEAMTAVGLVTRTHCGKGGSEAIGKGARLCANRPPEWNTESGSIDMYYWYWGTRALRQVGGRLWKTWRAPIVPIVFAHQRRDGSYVGSFDPVGVWGTSGGRIYSTAMMTMVAEMIEIRKWVEERKEAPEPGELPTPK